MLHLHKTRENELINLMQGDCLEKMKEIPDGSVDMILADPPYGTTACKWDIVIPLAPMWEQLKRVIKPNGAVLIFGSEPFSSELRLSNINDYKYDWKWDKVVGSNFVHAKRMPLKVYEDVIVFCAKGVYRPQMQERDARNCRKGGKEGGVNLVNVKHIKSDTTGKKKYPTNKIEINRMAGDLNSSKVIHQTQKPVALMEYLIKTYTLEGETVLDFTMGSGTTGVACKNLNRKFIGIELDEECFKIAQDRISAT